MSRKQIYREEQSDGSFKEYDVDKFSQEGQRHWYLLGRISEKLQDVSDQYLILKESQDSLIAKIKPELSEDKLMESGDGESKEQD